MVVAYVVVAFATLVATALIFAWYDAEGWKYIDFRNIAPGCLAGLITGLLWPMTITLAAIAGLLYLIVKKLVPYLIDLFAKEEK